MRFLHISDTHLGYNQYGLTERAQDFLDVFHEAVDVAIDEKVDFIIHSGDFFHTSRPSNKTFLEGLEIVRRLNDANIQIFTISGNHDRGSQVRDVSPLSILEPLGLKLVDTGFIDYEGVLIGGLKYISKAGLKQTGGIKPILEKYLDNLAPDAFKILMLHQEFKPFFPNSDLYMEQEIPEGFDYIGIGHYHIKQEPKNIKGSTVIYPGSTEFTAYNENEEKVDKGFYIIDIDGKNIKCTFKTFSSKRPFISLKLTEEDIQNQIYTLKEEIEKISSEDRKKPVVIFKGILKSLDIKDILSILEEKGIKREDVLTFRFNITREREELDITTGKTGEKEDIFTAIKELLDDEDLFSVVEEAVKTLQSFENTDEMKKFLKENPEILNI